MMFADFRKAFNLVYHLVLIDKLRIYGLNKTNVCIRITAEGWKTCREDNTY